jgi:8-oxo-dGTP diphosphatase
VCSSPTTTSDSSPRSKRSNCKRELDSEPNRIYSEIETTRDGPLARGSFYPQTLSKPFGCIPLPLPNKSFLEQITKVVPLDAREEADIRLAITWSLASDPDIHSIVYDVVLNTETQEFLLVHHRGTSLWLPCGGHVELGESPLDAAIREMREELGTYLEPIDENVSFVSVSPGEETSTHICLWFLFKVTENPTLVIDCKELFAAKWFSLSDLPYQQSDPNLSRFIAKLKVRFAKSLFGKENF